MFNFASSLVIFSSYLFVPKEVLESMHGGFRSNVEISDASVPRVHTRQLNFDHIIDSVISLKMKYREIR